MSILGGSAEKNEKMAGSQNFKFAVSYLTSFEEKDDGLAKNYRCWFETAVVVVDAVVVDDIAVVVVVSTSQTSSPKGIFLPANEEPKKSVKK